MPATTTRLALPSPTLTETADIPRDIRALALALDAAAIVDQGTLAARPVSSPAQPGIRGRFYWATDQGVAGILYHDNGTGWNAIGPGIIPAGAVGTTELADDAVTTAKIAAQTITNGDISLAAGISGTKIGSGTIDAVRLATGLFPSQGAGAATEALRALGTAAGTAAAGAHAAQHARTGADPLPADSVTLAAMAAAANGGPGAEAFLVRLSGNQAASRGNGWTWGDEVIDSSGRFAGNVFTCGRTGLYRFSWQIEITPNAGNWLHSRLQNSSTAERFAGSRIYSGQVTSLGSVMCKVNAGEVLTIDFNSNSSDSLTIFQRAADGSAFGTYWSGEYVGPA